MSTEDEEEESCELVSIEVPVEEEEETSSNTVIFPSSIEEEVFIQEFKNSPHLSEISDLSPPESEDFSPTTTLNFAPDQGSYSVQNKEEYGSGSQLGYPLSTPSIQSSQKGSTVFVHKTSPEGESKICQKSRNFMCCCIGFTSVSYYVYVQLIGCFMIVGGLLLSCLNFPWGQSIIFIGFGFILLFPCAILYCLSMLPILILCTCCCDILNYCIRMIRFFYYRKKNSKRYSTVWPLKRPLSPV